jgi:VWFA-related protein
VNARRVSLALVTLTSIGLGAQTPSGPPQFRAGVELVQLDVVVLDDKREPVRGLSATDFVVLEDGVGRTIRAFSPIELPSRTLATEAVWASEVPPDVATNRVGGQDGRLIVILMDRTIPPQQPTLVARKIAAAAIEGLGPNDLAAVVSTESGSVHDSRIQNFTDNRALLHRTINTHDPSTGVSKEAEEIGGKPDPLQDGRCLCGLCVLETMTRVADAVRDVPRRRKVLLFIGTDIIWQSYRPAAERGQDPGCETPLKDARNALFTAVDRANLTVHAIDPQGLITVGPQTQGFSLNGQDKGSVSAQKMRLDKQLDDMNRVLKGQQNIRQLPDRTGGRTITQRNDPETAVPEILRESMAYYVLAFERDASDRVIKPRSIEVKVARRGVQVHAQRKYVPPAMPAASSSSSSALPSSTTDALSGVMPNASLPLRFAVSPTAGADKNAIVRVDIDAGAFARADGTPARLDVAVLAVDRTGMPVASARQVSTITASAASAADPAEIIVPSQLELPAGDYGIRVAVADPELGKVASVFSDLTVADFANAHLAVSGVTIDVAARVGAAPAQTTRRTFRRSEHVRARLQISQGTARTDEIAPVSMRVRIIDAQGKAVRDQSSTFGPQTFSDRRADCLVTIPIANLPAGEYLLNMEASLERERSGRAVRFAVE